ncbi:MAG: hypothetical protein NW223_17105 [Hyphomicrobiaceae bacterium]|nr:hypothetical protein [Hyphomicrobiaceae bacterium]
MKTLVTLVIAGAALLAAGATGARAQDSYCERGFYAHARSPYGATYDARAAARSRAIGIWKTKIRTYCPDHSAFWWRAREKRIACDVYGGGVVCDIFGRPAHKLLR